ncbi:MAG: zinc-binding dehydrogenase, partial [Methyloprofundus sp.]|nr:zinc-binding dehydrogenase [Methyloprofundus sp.]
MQAQICTKYGSPDVLQLIEIERPIPKDNEVLIKIVASSVTAADGMMRKGSPVIGRLFLGLMKPKNPITGTGFAGEIEVVGKDVRLFKPGDQVFGESVLGAGTNAEYVCVAEQGVLAIKPTNMSYAEAAPVCDGALTSMNFLKDLANIQPGQSILVNGASGSLGTSAIQIARYFGAEVTGVCSTTNLERVKSVGADKVSDYTKEDFTSAGQSYDIIYDTLGKSSFSSCKRSLTAKGQYLSPVFGVSHLLQMLWTSKVGSK